MQVTELSYGVTIKRYFKSSPTEVGLELYWLSIMNALYNKHPFRSFWDGLIIELYPKGMSEELDEYNAAGLYWASSDLVQISVSDLKGATDVLNHELGHHWADKCGISPPKTSMQHAIKACFLDHFDGLENKYNEMLAEAYRVTLGLDSLNHAYRDVVIEKGKQSPARALMQCAWKATQIAGDQHVKGLTATDHGLYWYQRPWWRFWSWDRRVVQVL